MLSDSYVPVLVTAAMFFKGSKFPHQFYAEPVRNIHTKFASNWSSIFRGEDFWKKSHKNREKTSKKGNNFNKA